MFAATLVILLGGVAAFVRINDPYARFGGTSKAARVFGPSANGPLLTELQLRNVPSRALDEAEIVILGDSRGRRLTVERVATVKERAVLNLASGGSSMEESLFLFQERADRLKSLRLIIVTAPLERFAEAPAPDRCREAALLANSTLRYLLNWQMFKDSWTIRMTPANSPKFSWVKGHLTPAQRAEGDMAILRSWRQMFESYDSDRAAARMELVERTLAPFLARHTRVVFWQPPVQERIWRIIPELRLEDAARQLHERLGRMGSVLDMTRETALRGRALTFDDLVHTAKDSPILLETMLETGG